MNIYRYNFLFSTILTWLSLRLCLTVSYVRLVRVFRILHVALKLSCLFTFFLLFSFCTFGQWPGQCHTHCPRPPRPPASAHYLLLLVLPMSVLNSPAIWASKCLAGKFLFLLNSWLLQKYFGQIKKHFTIACACVWVCGCVCVCVAANFRCFCLVT